MKQLKQSPEANHEGNDVDTCSGGPDPIQKFGIGVRDLLARKITVMNLAKLVSFHALNIVQDRVEVHG